MRKSIVVRVLTGLGGLVLLGLGACIAAEAFFGAELTAKAGALLARKDALAVLVTIVAMLALAALGCAAIACMLPRRRVAQDGYVMQKGENGPIGVSINAIEKQVRTCVEKHDVIASADIAISDEREGLVILLTVDQVAGVNIPLSVGLMQKQIKEYVTSCTGVDVHEVRVLVENNTTNVVASPFAVQDPVMPMSRPAAEAPRAVEAAAEPEPAVEAAPAAPVAIPEMPPMPEQSAMMDEEDERPLHQRIFGAEEQPVFVPAPPDLVLEAKAEEAAQEPAEEAEADAEAAEDAEEASQADVADAEETILPEDEAAEAGNAYSEAAQREDGLPVDDNGEVEADEADSTLRDALI